MRKILGLLLLLSIACGCTGTRTGNPGNNDDPIPSGVVVAQSNLERDLQPEVSTETIATFGSDNRAFAFALYHELAKTPGNVFFSPYSVSTALAMTYAGAKGETEKQMATALHFTLPQAELHAAFNATDLEIAMRKDQLVPSVGGEQTQGKGFELAVANQTWGQQGYKFVDGYLDTLAVNYGARMFLLDFQKTEAARTTINDWIAEQTADRIKDLLVPGSLPSDAVLVLTNAIYFKAGWATEFQAAQTQPASFMAESGARNVQMMHGGGYMNYAEVQGYQAVEIPYISKDVSMIAVLPPAGAFADAAKKFDSALFEDLHAKLSTYSVTLSLPKWSFEWGATSLKTPLSTLGMERAFSPAADLSGIGGKPGDLLVGDVFHKTFVAVDEKGTEAGAATAVVVVGVSAPVVPSVTVTFDRPFMFLIYDKPTGQVLFFGHLAEPK